MRLRVGGFVVALAAAVVLVVAGTASSGGSTPQGTAWPERGLKGTGTVNGPVALAVSAKSAPFVRRHSAQSRITLNFGFPVRDQVALDALIAQEAQSHSYI